MTAKLKKLFLRYGWNIMTMFLMLIILLPEAAFNQCPNDNNFHVSLPAPPCGTNNMVNIGAGTYAEVPVIIGASYTFGTCGSSFDTQLTGYEAGQSSSFFFNDDNGPECTGTSASVTWISTFTGTLWVLIDLHDCDSCNAPFLLPTTDCPGLGSAVLSYQQDNNLTITSSGEDMCSGESRSLTATPIGGIFSGVGVSNDVFTAPSSTTPYTITYTYGECLVTQTINVFQNPSVSIIGTTSFCPGDSVKLTANPVAGSGNITTYQWKFNGLDTGTDADTIITKQPGNYTVVVTNSNDCIATSPVVAVTEFVAPIVAIVGDDGFCPGGSVTLTANAFPGSGSITVYQWKLNGVDIGFNNGILNANQAGDYTIEIINSNDCSTESTVKTVSQYQASIVTTTGDTSFCTGSTVLLTANAIAGSSAIISYQWKLNGGNIGTNDSTYSADQVGNYSVVVTDANGCTTATSSSLVIAKPAISLVATGTDITCKDSMNGTATVIVNGGLPPYNYEWNTTSTDITLTDLGVGVYIVTVTDSNKCSAVSNSVLVNATSTLDINVISITNSTCDNVNKGAIVTVASGGTTPYLFSINSGPLLPTGVFNDLPDGAYRVRVQDANGCGEDTNLVIKNISSLPDATIFTTDIDNDNSICPGDSLTLFVNTSAVSYEWSQTGTNDSIVVTLAGSYSVTVTNSNGCVDSGFVVVTVFDSLQVTACCDDSITLGNSVQVTATGGTQYSWSPSDGLDNANSESPMAAPLATTVYLVTVSDMNGCRDMDTVVIYVDQSTINLNIPNLFTPNGDGINEVWRIDNSELCGSCEVNIFNRWGNEVFSGADCVIDWDGTKNGKQLSDGTYYYILNCLGTGEFYKGAVTILR